MPPTADPSTGNLSLTLSEENYRTLGGQLSDLLDDYERDHSQRIADVEVSWKLYDAEPRQKQRSFPWRGASNLVVPYIRTAADAIIAQHIALVFDNPTKVWVSRSENEKFANNYESDVLRFCNWAARNEIDGFFPLLDWITENVVLGQSYLLAKWQESSLRPPPPTQGLCRPSPGPAKDHTTPLGSLGAHPPGSHPVRARCPHPGIPTRRHPGIPLVGRPRAQHRVPRLAR